MPSLPRAAQASSMLSLLPYELALYIFDILLGATHGDEPLRLKICHTSSDWLRFLSAHPRYWTNIAVMSNTPQDLVLHYISLASPLPLRFKIILTSADPVVNLAYLAPHVSAASHFSVESDHEETLSRLHSTFQGLSGPRLRFFGVFFHETPIRGLRNRTPLLPMPWFGPNTASLEVLHLCCAVIPFSVYTFPRLRILRLWGVHPRYSLDIRALRSVIASSPVLTDVTFRRFSCTGASAPSVLPVSSSTITSLELGFSGDGTIGALAALLSFPALVNLTIELSSADHELPTSLSVTLGTLTARPFRMRIARLLAPFPALTSLDIRHSLPSAFLSLLRASVAHATAHRVNLLPHLRSLTMNEGDLSDIRRFAALYILPSSPTKTTPLVRLHVAAPDPPVCGPSTSIDAYCLLWLASHVSDFMLSPGGPPV
ncbi:hypothetical protein C8R46DRAFT_1240138 [Mycena filopes]|nr:hypothetical protein C8R46DRAFT_1240138 [Mycena filopes]